MTTTATTAEVQETRPSDAYPASKGENLEKLYKIAIIAIAIAIFILAVDIWQDNILHSRITELEREVADYRKEFAEQKDNFNSEIFTSKNELLNYKNELFQKESEQNKIIESFTNNERIIAIEGKIEEHLNILNCLKTKRYWQYEQCFK